MIEITHTIRGQAQTIKLRDKDVEALQEFYKRVDYLTEINKEKEPEAIKTNEKPYYKTGIKVIEGVNYFKCRYFCECGNEKNRYIPLGQQDVRCHRCSSIIDVEPATKKVGKDGVPERDSKGNFFVAYGRSD